jgi:NAD(P)-dependent dehydrogenase (short-subunit alcohol dehydrogenase family)
MGLLNDGQDLHAVIVGCSGGIGNALTQQLLDHPHISAVTGLCRQKTDIQHAKFTEIEFDLKDEASILQATEAVKPFHLLIVATGILHQDQLQPEKSLSTLRSDCMETLFLINTIGPTLILQGLLKKLVPNVPGIMAVISAKVGSITDNHLGGWYGYRSSKAALNMVMRCASIEVQRFQPLHTVVSLHPGTVGTQLSEPFTKNYPAEAIFPPEKAAELLLKVIDEIGPEDNGFMLNWDGSRLPF